MEKKFIKTTDTETANKLLALNFTLISHIGSVYTFINDVPKNVTFESVDTKKIAYDNILSL
jgi:hypothetical protein